MDPLRELFDHHCWATDTLIAHCATLPPDAWQATVPGTAGTVHHTLVHIVGADGRYLRLLTGTAPAVQESAPPPLDQLRAQFAAQARQWQAALDRVDELDVSIPARGDRPEMPHARNLLLLQALHHGNDHRTHVCTILGARGLPNVDVSGWAYWLAKTSA
ncbi:MAG TPA: DinB family protein [Chloroflexota bacterium]|jgi:uncharacterized damage-inducible protein DinB|nr:DinB family protein [Chloroflexota bacterium]